MKESISDARNRQTGNDLLDERHRAQTRFAVWGYVESQVDFFETTVEWDWNSKDTSLIEQESDQADVALSLKQIEFGLCRQVRLEQLRSNFVIRKDQMLPLGG
jgi:hypothetical protein